MAEKQYVVRITLPVVLTYYNVKAADSHEAFEYVNEELSAEDADAAHYVWSDADTDVWTQEEVESIIGTKALTSMTRVDLLRLIANLPRGNIESSPRL